jgi:O-antigen ligase
MTLAAVGLLASFGGEAYWALMKTILNPTADYNWSGGSETGRMEIWKRGMGYMAANPLLGVGVRCFSVAEGTLSAQAAQQAIGIGFKWSTAHNSFVQIAAELGVGGLILFSAMLAHAFRKLWRIARLRPKGDAQLRSRVSLAQALLASMVGFVLTGFFLSMAYGAVLYLFIAQIVAFSHVIDREVQAAATAGSLVPAGRT